MVFLFLFCSVFFSPTAFKKRQFFQYTALMLCPMTTCLGGSCLRSSFVNRKILPLGVIENLVNTSWQVFLLWLVNSLDKGNYLLPFELLNVHETEVSWSALSKKWSKLKGGIYRSAVLEVNGTSVAHLISWLHCPLEKLTS